MEHVFNLYSTQNTLCIYKNSAHCPIRRHKTKDVKYSIHFSYDSDLHCMLDPSPVT